MWSAATDPRVIAARVRRAGPNGKRAFDASDLTVHSLRGQVHEHLLINRSGTPIRLDIIEGTALAGPVSLHFDLPDDHHLLERIGAIRAFTSAAPPGRRHLQLARRVHALHATDARNDGASLREIADLMLGPGPWPGDGEHRKSLVRRMIATGERMLRDGPRAILAGAGFSKKL